MTSKIEVTKMIETLKAAANKDKATANVLHMFALRGRARQRVTVDGLKQRMKKEGFDHDNQEYRSILKLLESVGIGRLQMDARGRVKALTDINLTLQSIGKAALGQEKALKSFRQRNRFSKVQVAQPKTLVSAPASSDSAPSIGISGISLVVGGKAVSISLGADLSAAEITAIVERFQDVKHV